MLVTTNLFEIFEKALDSTFSNFCKRCVCVQRTHVFQNFSYFSPFFFNEIFGNKKRDYHLSSLVISSSDIIPVCFNRLSNEWNM